MKDMEKLLRRAGRIEVPDSLDRRVERLIQTAELGRVRPASRPVPLWACIAACLACVVLGFLAHLQGEQAAAVESTAPALIYIVEPGAALPAVVGTGQRKSSPGFFHRKKGEVKTLYQG